MICFVIIFRYIALFTAFCMLSGCLGGTIAQQIVRSIATSVADKTLARAMDVDEEEEYTEAQYTAAANISAQNNALQKTALQGPAAQNVTLKNNAKQFTPLQDTAPDPYKIAFVNAAFEEVRPIAEPLPEHIVEVETQVIVVKGNPLVRVELFNLLIGEEKNAVYENARMMGATSLPQKREWHNWGVATGAIQGVEHTDVEQKDALQKDVLQKETLKHAVQKNKKLITFLIPPEFGKLPSGTVAVVELANPGELNMARYKIN